MSYRPKPTTFVAARIRRGGQEVMAHSVANEDHMPNGMLMPDCGVVPRWQDQDWLWLQFKFLNPAYVRFCKRCWG